MRTNKTTNTTGLTIGLDLGDRRHAVCVLNARGDIISEETLPNTRACLEQLSKRYAAATIAMETGTHSPWVSRLFEDRGHTVYVANARKVRAISQSITKTDEHDARMLARLCRADPSLLSPIKHRSERCQRDLVQLKAREALVRARVNLINSTRLLLKSLGVFAPAQVKATAFVRKLRPLLDNASTSLVEPLLHSIDALSAQIKMLEDKLEELARIQYPDTERLKQIPGVGPITALFYILTLESPARFPRNRDVGAYLGMVPRRHQSGDTDIPLPITKAGNTHLRCLLVNCAHYILGPFGPPSALREAGLRIAAKGGKPAKKRAVIATARKLAVTMMALWKTGSVYQALPEAA